MTNVKKYYKNVRLNYLYTAVTSFNLTQGIWMIYLASKGLSLLWLGILEGGVFHVTSLIMETPPTGAVADVLGRKFSRQLGLVIGIIYSVIMLMGGTDKWHFVIAFIFCALSYNLESGAGEALVYDSLKVNNKENDYTKVNGINEVFIQGASGIGIALGGYMLSPIMIRHL